MYVSDQHWPFQQSRGRDAVWHCSFDNCNVTSTSCCLFYINILLDVILANVKFISMKLKLM